MTLQRRLQKLVLRPSLLGFPPVCSIPCLVVPGTGTVLSFISLIVHCSIHLKGTSCWLFQMMSLSILIIISAYVTPTVVKGSTQSLQIRHAVYPNIAVNLTGCTYGLWKMVFSSVLNLFCFKLIKSFCSHQQLLKRKKYVVSILFSCTSLYMQSVDENSVHWSPKGFCQWLHGADIHPLQ